jgi:hypothetical protein
METLINYLFDPLVSAWKLFLVLCFICAIFYGILNLILQIVHKTIRAKTIRLKGYPPPHCDGDGDMNNEAGTTEDKGLFPVN